VSGSNEQRSQRHSNKYQNLCQIEEVEEPLLRMEKQIGLKRKRKKTEFRGDQKLWLKAVQCQLHFPPACLAGYLGCLNRLGFSMTRVISSTRLSPGFELGTTGARESYYMH